MLRLTRLYNSRNILEEENQQAVKYLRLSFVSQSGLVDAGGQVYSGLKKATPSLSFAGSNRHHVFVTITCAELLEIISMWK